MTRAPNPLPPKAKIFKKIIKLSDQDIIELLRGSEKERERALECFFSDPELARRAIQYVKSMGGNKHDAEDVFTESVVEFDRAVRSGRFEGRSSLRTYFQAIVKYKWLEQRRLYARPPAKTSLQQTDEVFDPEENLIFKEYEVMIGGLIAQIGERCQKLLRLFQLNLTMDEIAQNTGLANANVAGNEVFKCRKRLRALIENLPELNEILDTFNLKKNDPRRIEQN